MVMASTIRGSCSPLVSRDNIAAMAFVRHVKTSSHHHPVPACVLDHDHRRSRSRSASVSSRSEWLASNNLSTELALVGGTGGTNAALRLSKSSVRKLGRKSEVTCQVAGTAVPGDATNGIDDYIPNFTDKSLPLKIRAICFYLWTYTVSVPLFVVMLALQPFVLLFDKYRRKAQHFVNKLWASATILLFYKAEILGLENLPSSDEPAVYVANHQSFLDIYTLFLLGRPFKFISKTSNFWIPIIGWSMYLTGHVPLDRLDKRSQVECLKKCISLVKKGVPVLFFPEGTRTSDGKMHAFKKGAFNVAAKGNVPVVPIALIGTGKLMPNGLESTLRPGKVKVIIHPQIQGGSADELCNKSRDVIAQTLVKYGLPVA